MKEFPKSLFLIACFNLLPALLSVFFLFGAVHPFGLVQNGWLRFLLYVATNLLWLLPVASFFLGLNEVRRGYVWRAWAVLLGGAVLTLADVLLLAA